MRVPLRSLNLSLVEAAARQTNAAIDAIQRGKFDVAITLAGAAEGMLKERTTKIPSIFEIALFLRTAEEGTRDLYSKKELIVFLNAERDWLKHGGEAEMEIPCLVAAMTVARAISKFDEPSSKMREFSNWLKKNIDRL
jgi:hypothetical protein